MPVIEKQGLRWYMHNDNPNILYPSCTTVIGWKDKLFGKWRNFHNMDAANFGTSIHFQVEKYVYDVFKIGNPSEMSFPNISIWNFSEEEGRRRQKSSMNMWFKFLEDHKSYEPIAQELALFQEVPKRYAGRIDQYVKLDSKYILLDLKTGGFWPEYDFQLAGYYQLLKEFAQVDEAWVLFLDSREDRNPERTYKVKIYSKEDLERNLIGFNELLDEYYRNDVFGLVNGNGDEE